MKHILLFFPLVFATSCSNELSRSNAENQIVEALQFPQDELLRLIVEDRTIYMMNTQRDWEKYREAGLLTYRSFGKSSSGGSFPTVTIGGSGVRAELTPKGKEYLKSEIKTAGYEKYVMVKQADLEFGEITGIKSYPENSSAMVDYTIKRTNITPFGALSHLKEEIIEKTASFDKYDDGWRLRKQN
ncbi:MAG: hypothetical protein WBA61_14130 [Aequorivita sp.]